MDYKKYIATVEGFPKEGISFKDCTPLLQMVKHFIVHVMKWQKLQKV